MGASSSQEALRTMCIETQLAKLLPSSLKLKLELMLKFITLIELGYIVKMCFSSRWVIV